MLMPSKVKFRKMHKGRGRNKRNATTKIEVSFGSYGLKALDGAWVTSRQIEAARRAMTRYIKRGGKVWIRIFPDKPITFHGNENTMGGGKGAVDHYVAVVRPGTVMFEMDGISEEIAREALRLAGHKLPMRARFVTK
ncbi:50S ribosomal protein L16 [Patescibacteria group bacterium]|nr:50S ribosomal protein L16 [Patescibacteria group bacterium]MBU1915810.1 50S ribosomal protein L16 [Patescibacteria group bacterium]